MYERTVSAFDRVRITPLQYNKKGAKKAPFLFEKNRIGRNTVQTNLFCGFLSERPACGERGVVGCVVGNNAVLDHYAAV